MKMLQVLVPAVIAASTLFVGNAQAATVNGFANGGFEIDGSPATPAASWTPAVSGYSRSTDARTGGFSLELMSPALNAAVALQNSGEQVGLPTLTEGDNPLLSFWAKGFAGDTGNVSYALRYLNESGTILVDGGSTQFQSSINTSGWTEITRDLGMVPFGATAAFIEFSQAIGPIGVDPPSGTVFLGGTVLIDDLFLGVESAAVPEPTSVALLGLGGLAMIIRRRRRKFIG